MSELSEHNKRVVSVLVEAICRADLAVFDEVYTAEAAAAARGLSTE